MRKIGPAYSENIVGYLTGKKAGAIASSEKEAQNNVDLRGPHSFAIGVGTAKIVVDSGEGNFQRYADVLEGSWKRGSSPFKFLEIALYGGGAAGAGLDKVKRDTNRPITGSFQTITRNTTFSLTPQ